jgi:hypothetical protein
MAKEKWVCAVCGKANECTQGSVLGHFKEAHAGMFDVFPNPLVARESLIIVAE